MTTYAYSLYHDPDTIYEEEVSNQLFDAMPPPASSGLVPYPDAEDLCARGAGAQEDVPFSLLPHLANIALSAVSGTVGGAVGGAAYWGVVGGTFGLGFMTYLAGMKQAVLLTGGQEVIHIPGGNLAAYEPEPSVGAMFHHLVAASFSVGLVSGALYGAASGLWNAQYQEYFDTAVDQDAAVVGVCCAAPQGY